MAKDTVHTLGIELTSEVGLDGEFQDRLGQWNAEDGVCYWMDFEGLAIPNEKVDEVRQYIEALLDKARAKPQETDKDGNNDSE